MSKNLIRSSLDASIRGQLRHALQTVGYEVIPLKSAADNVLANVPREISLTITASPSKGQDATIDLAEVLASHGYRVTPHLSAQQVRDRAHLRELVSRCQRANITGAFVVGGDPTDTQTEFRDAYALLTALHDLDHSFADIGIAGHPEGHPVVSDEVMLEAMRAKSPLATSITTQMCFDSQRLVRFADHLMGHGIRLPVHVGIPGSVRRQKLLRISSSLGIGESARFLKKQQAMFWRFLMPGGFRPDSQIRALASRLDDPGQRIRGFHIFTFNDLEATEGWRRKALLRLARD